MAKSWRLQVGSLGSGNHFIEVSLDEGQFTDGPVGLQRRRSAVPRKEPPELLVGWRSSRLLIR